MRVKDCQNCPKCKRKVWSSYHVPLNYHPIGMSHAYAFCNLHKKRVRDVKKCELILKEAGKYADNPILNNAT